MFLGYERRGKSCTRGEAPVTIECETHQKILGKRHATHPAVTSTARKAARL